METDPNLIKDGAGISALCAQLRGAKAIALDTEFIRESTFFPIVEIIQVATTEKAWLIDARVFKQGYAPGPDPAPGKDRAYSAEIEPFLEILRDPKILKVMHAAYGDQECFYTSFGTIAVPCLDTAVAASLCGMGEGIGLARLVKQIIGIDLPKGHSRTNWSVRPLPAQLAEYALADVLYLLEVTDILGAKLREKDRYDWAITLSSEGISPRAFVPAPEDLIKKHVSGGRLDRKAIAALIELLRWREARVRKVNLPRRWVADDQVLVDLAKVRPKDLEHLSAFRGLNKGEIKTSGAEILKALRRSEQDPSLTQIDAPRGRKVVPPSDEEQHVLDLLKVYLSILGEKHGVAQKHLGTSAQLLNVIRVKNLTEQTLVSEGGLSTLAVQMIGKDLIDLMNGSVGLGLNNGRVEMIDFEPGEPREPSESRE